MWEHWLGEDNKHASLPTRDTGPGFKNRDMRAPELAEGRRRTGTIQTLQPEPCHCWGGRHVLHVLQSR